MDYASLLSLLETNNFNVGGFDKMIQPPLLRSLDFHFDVVLENQRGLKILGIPLFSRQSLMPCIDPPPYQHLDGLPVLLAYDSIDNYALPDFGWSWLWDTWHVLMLNDVDELGWAYLLLFLRSLKWHGKYYFGDFVRRRMWIRMRQRDHVELDLETEHLLYVDATGEEERGKNPHAQPSEPAGTTVGAIVIE